MSAIDLLRRAAGKSPGYLARRGLQEIRRRAFSRSFARRLRDLTPSAVAREAGAGSLLELWRGQASGAFRLSAGDRERLREAYRGPYAAQGTALRARVEKILLHEFDLLGSGPTRLGPDIDWHRDFKSGRRWDLLPSERIDFVEPDRDSDIKVPWELSRGQHLTALGRGWVVDRDERAPAEFERQVRSWIRGNPVGLGVNWACAMDVALRAVSWIWALGLLDDAPLPAEFVEEALFSLYLHGLWIPEHLEMGEVNGNHILSDALGLVACGTVFRDTPAGKGWLETGARLLEEEILRQVDEDGVDFEGSVAYHRLVLEIFLVGARFLETAGRPVSARYLGRLEAMLGFVHAYMTPDGLSPVIGDADDGRALVLGETEIRDHRYLLSTGAALFGRAEWKERAGGFWEDSLWLLGAQARDRFEALPARADDSSRGFAASGFYALRSPAHTLFVDAGPVGFRGRGGHGHNDCLSFEWHAAGRPLLTDSGTYVYTASPQWRNRFRSTEFHNTIRVDGREINRFPSPLALWSLKNDARPVGVRFEPGGERDVLEAGHTGYQRLQDPVTLRREFEFDRRNPRLFLRDRAEGRAEHLIEFYFHAAPGSQPSRVSDSAVAFRWEDGGEVRLEKVSGPSILWEAVSGWSSPSYGVKTERPVWKASARLRLPIRIDWALSFRASPGAAGAPL